MAGFVAWKRRTAICALILLLLTLWAVRLRANWTALYLVQAQDVPILFLASAAMLLSIFWRPRWPLPRHCPRMWSLLLAGMIIAALLAWGTYAIMGDYPLSRDEHMVLFDMIVFDHGSLAMPLAPEWRSYASVLVPEFLLNSDQPIGLVSDYLPMNALMRLGFSKLADPVWLNPLLLMAGGAALLDVARRTFGPGDRACMVVLLVYWLSSQALVTAMTAYSMTAHLALNLMWLASFLRGGKLWNAVAMLIGFVAVGLHQLAFHPFFIAPFLLWKLRGGQWKLVAVFACAYGAIMLWWICYPIIVSRAVAVTTGSASEGNFLTQKLVPLLVQHDPRTVPLMVLNLMRFFAWQNLALLPLLIAGLPLAVRERGLARALLVGAVGWLFLVTLLMPSQGRGWGYRYLHSYIGSFALLSGFGYRELRRRMAEQADGIVILLSSLTAFVSLPVVLTSTYRFVQPHLAMHRLLDAQPTLFVLIDDNRGPPSNVWSDTPTDDVRNRPDLINRPLRLSAERLSPAGLVNLCSRGAVTLMTRADMHRVGFVLSLPDQSPKFDALVSRAGRQAPRCFRAAQF